MPLSGNSGSYLLSQCQHMKHNPNLTVALINKVKSDKGGYTRETLEALGVGWPPKRGWRKELLRMARANEAKALVVSTSPPEAGAIPHWEVIKHRMLILPPEARINVIGNLLQMYCQHCGRGKSVGVFCPCGVGP